MWLFGQTLAVKIVNVVGLMALARWLLKEDFGLFALASTIMIVGALLRNLGIKEVLIQGPRHFALWSSSAFWLSVLTSASAFVVMAIAAPVAAWLYNDARLTVMVTVMALGVLIDGLATVPLAMLERQMRFGAIAAVNAVRAIGTMGLCIILAGFKWGPHSLVVPIPVMALVVAVIVFALARPEIRLRPRPRRWRYLLGRGGVVFAASLVLLVVRYGDYAILGLVCSEDKRETGLYYFAFQQSLQVAMLVGLNIMRLLLPALSRLKDDVPRQTDAFLRAVRMLSVMAVPLVLGQAATAEPVVNLLFGAKWHASAALIQILCVGMAVQIVAAPAESLLHAQRRYRTRLCIAIVSALSFVAVVVPATYWYKATGTALAVAGHSIVIGVGQLWLVVGYGGRGWRDVVGAVAWPFVVAAGAVGVGFAGASALPDLPGRDVWRIGVTVLLSVPAYILAVRAFAPATWNEARQLIRTQVTARMSVSGGKANE